MELDDSLKPNIRSCNKTRDNNNVIFWDLPYDILMEIMCRLPDKPLHRSKCLSKELCLLISQVCIPRITLLPTTARPKPVVGLYFRAYKAKPGNPPFLARSKLHHLLYHSSGDWIPGYGGGRIVGHYASIKEDDHERGQLFGWGECVGSYGLPFTPIPDELLDCCNGLLLFLHNDSSQYYVCNPITKQCVFIPGLPLRWHQCESFYAALVFDPSKSPYYRVVRFDRYHRFDRVQRERLFLDIFSSANKSWSRHSVDLDPFILEESWFRSSTYFNGSLFRLAFSWHLVQFDLDEEEISVCVTKLPLTFKLCKGLMGCIGVLMGQLCYANEYCDTIHIWSLEKKEGSCNNVGRWILSHRINIYDFDLTSDLELFREGSSPMTKWVGPVAFHPSSNIIFLGTPFLILSYNLDNRRVEELIRIEKEVIYPGCYYPAFPYVRLLSPFNETGNIGTLPIC